MKDALKPCPFCGEEVTIEISGEFIQVLHKPGNDCFLDDTEDFYEDVGQLESIIAKWNTRVNK